MITNSYDELNRPKTASPVAAFRQLSAAPAVGICLKSECTRHSRYGQGGGSKFRSGAVTLCVSYPLFRPRLFFENRLQNSFENRSNITLGNQSEIPLKNRSKVAFEHPPKTVLKSRSKSGFEPQTGHLFEKTDLAPKKPQNLRFSKPNRRPNSAYDRFSEPNPIKHICHKPLNIISAALPAGNRHNHTRHTSLNLISPILTPDRTRKMKKIDPRIRAQRTRVWSRAPVVKRLYFPHESAREGTMGLQSVCSVCNRYPGDEPLRFVDPGPGAVCRDCYVFGTRCCIAGCDEPAVHKSFYCRDHYIDDQWDHDTAIEQIVWQRDYSIEEDSPQSPDGIDAQNLSKQLSAAMRKHGLMTAPFDRRFSKNKAPWEGAER